MSTSAARILANQANAQHSTGPKTSEGKAQSRANAYKHGLTGNGVVVSEKDAAKIEQLTAELKAELRPSNTTGRMLVERMAVLGVRMERSVAQESAAISENVRLAEADFEAPEGLDEKTVAKLRREAGEIALFDPSKEACLARKYEAAAERGFFRALKEFRQIEKEKAATAFPEVGAAKKAVLGSFKQMEKLASLMETLPAPAARSTPTTPSKSVATAWNPPVGGSFELPITIGRSR
jgi:hypothetical protein